MANENVARFEELLKGDDALKARLEELAKAYDGPADDQKAVFDATIGKLAAEAGFPFTFEHVGRLGADAPGRLFLRKEAISRHAWLPMGYTFSRKGGRERVHGA